MILAKSVEKARKWVADVVGSMPDQIEETLANARLIAAAPDLLAACQALLEPGDTFSSEDAIRIIDAARAAVVKATQTK